MSIATVPADHQLETGAKNATTEDQPVLPVLLFVLAITALSYVAALRFEFVYDDEGQIVNNTFVHSWRFVPQYFLGNVWQQMSPLVAGNYYRPLNILWFRVNDAVFGLHPAGWHVMAIALHLLATALAFAIARRLTGNSLVAALTSLVFGIHPMRHEVVAWVSGMTESLWAVFFFAAFLAYLKSRETRRILWMTMSCVLYAAALLAKETAIVLPLIVFAHAWLYRDRAGMNTPGQLRGWLREAATVALAYVPIAVVYFVVRVYALQGFEHPLNHLSLRTFVLTLPSILLFYVRQWLVPIRMSEFYDMPFQSQFSVPHVLLPALALAALAALLWMFRRKLGAREMSFAVIWMIAPLLPALDLAVLPAGELVHDRYFYVPSFGAALMVALVLRPLAHGAPVFGYPRRLVIATLLLIAALCYGTAKADSYWSDDLALYSRANDVDGRYTLVRADLAVALAMHGDENNAISILMRVVKEEPNNWGANYYLGRVLYLQGNYFGAEHYLQHAKEINPTLADAYLNLGLVDLRTDRAVESEANLRRAVELRPFEPNMRFALGVVLELRGDCSEARSEFAEALSMEPEFPRAAEQMRKCVEAPAQGGSSVAVAPAVAKQESRPPKGDAAARP